ncbi:MAG: response regulator receiver protein [Variovorax sp.]|jgi:DNA-binding NarL/FixJ family response regulator|nr:response regulator receiver protein [Variovorax sp.]
MMVPCCRASPMLSQTQTPFADPMTFKTYLVEDSPVIRDNLVGFLEDIAHAEVVAHASTENEAVAWLKTHHDQWDVAIIDLFLEQGNGLEVVGACRDRSAGQKVVVLTNYATPAMRARAKALGADAFFDKSAEIDELVEYCEQLGTARR